MVEDRQYSICSSYKIYSDLYLKELAKSDVIQTIRAVEHDTLFGHCLSQVFRGLRLSGTGRTLGSTPKVQMQSSK